MSTYEYYTLDVFTQMRFQGNPLAVFPDAHGISEQSMLAIAGELNLSETVFLTKATDGQSVARARIFTPKKELDFAGHPTVGTAHLLHMLGRVTTSFTLQENVGAVPIDIDRTANGAADFFLTTPRITAAETLPADLCAELLALEHDDIAESPPQFLTAGSPLLFVQLRSKEAVDKARINTAVLPKALGSINSGGTFIFARNPSGSDPSAPNPYDVYSRMFAPQIGIAEDPATGGATGPLAAYMLAHGLIPNDKPVNFISEQGVLMGRRSLLHVRVQPAQPFPVIQVGGSCVVVARAAMTVE